MTTFFSPLIGKVQTIIVMARPSSLSLESLDLTLCSASFLLASQPSRLALFLSLSLDTSLFSSFLLLELDTSLSLLSPLRKPGQSVAPVFDSWVDRGNKV